MLIFALLLQCFFHAVVLGIEVKYKSEPGEDVDYKETNISASKITNENFNTRVYELSVEKYMENEHQLELVSNLPIVEKVYIIDVGQEIPPYFQSLPNVKDINLKNNKITYIKKDLFSSTPVNRVFLERNQISKIENGSFGQQVTVVHLQCNKIRTVSADWFQNPFILETLDLKGNNIQVIPTDLLKNFTEIRVIELSYNQIITIEARAFGNRNDFDWLRLDNNFLTEIQPVIFKPGNITITNFDIMYNKITFLSNWFMKKVQIKSEANIYGNPWQCACYEMIKSWVPANVFQHGPEDELNCVSKTGDLANVCEQKAEKAVVKHYKENISPDEMIENHCRSTQW